ncbi:holo-ACP synthase [Floccifex sp.]|uniref:holo-ACP synthase n=1 Tax=Floccifex sp. TaxID=2815810 RepID=UPI003F07145B
MIVGIGCDIVQLSRIKDPISLANRILSNKELVQFHQLHGHRQLEFLAGHFAVKEALVKAMDIPCLITDFEIEYENNKPVVYFKGYRIFVSISHEKEYAIANAIVERIL